MIIPKSIWLEFSDFQYTRLKIWESAFTYIFNHPIFGYGSGSFTEIFKLETGLWKGHAHNLPIELIFSFGLPAGILILIPFLSILFLGLRNILFSNIYENTNFIFDKAIVISFSLLAFYHLFDMTYFDGRISITGWIMFAAIKNKLRENENTFRFKERN